MTILDIQKRARELGRIRIGDRVASGRGDRPNKLDKPRLTSPSKALIENAARVYGGEVKEWESPAGPQWQVYVAAEAIDVILPPGDMALDQHYELWTGGGCQRRCDGEVESMSDSACMCPEDVDLMAELANQGQACRPTTRLKVMLPKVGDLGLWRLESHGYHAAAELAGTLEILRAGGLGRAMLRGTLRIEQRTAKKPGVGTLRYIVPVLELADLNLEQLAAGASKALPAGAAAIPLGRDAALPAPAPPPRPEEPESPEAAAAEAAPPAAKRSRARRAKAPDSTPEPDASSPPRANADGEVLATPAQIRKLMVLSEQRGYSDQQRREAAGVASFKDLTKDRASHLIDEWETGSDTREAPEGDDIEGEVVDELDQLIALLDQAFTGPVSRSRYRDTLLKRQGVDSLEDLTAEQIEVEMATLRSKVSA